MSIRQKKREYTVKKLFCILIILISVNTNCFEFCNTQGYARAQVGSSFSRCADICLNNQDWTITNEGYNRDLGTAPLFSWGLGFHANSLISFGLSLQFRSGYTYVKKQTIRLENYTLPLNEDFFPSLNPFTRIFNLDNANFMFDIFINRVGKDSYYLHRSGDFALIPYTGFSIGKSKNTVYNFHTATQSTGNVGGFIFTNTRAIMNYKSSDSLGWQFHLGFNAAIKENILLGLGYCYYDAGTFCSNNYTIDDLDGVKLYGISAWKGKLRAHELVGSLSISF